MFLFDELLRDGLGNRRRKVAYCKVYLSSLRKTLSITVIRKPSPERLSLFFSGLNPSEARQRLGLTSRLVTSQRPEKSNAKIRGIYMLVKWTSGAYPKYFFLHSNTHNYGEVR